MKVVITGGRDYSEREFVYETLDRIHANVGISLLIEGGATGADRLGRDWAISRGIKYHTEEAQWKDLSHPDARIKRNAYGEYDANAGHRRNKKMLTDHPDALVVVFPGGDGTKDCVRTAIKLGMKIT